jgi:hypothetical protein
MKEDRFEALMRDAAHTFRKPPEPDLDEMWSGIERAMDAEAVQRRAAGSRWPRWTGTIGIIAATLVVGIGLGRISMTGRQAATPNRVATVQPVQPAPVASTAIASGFDVETSRYLGQTAALLIALPSEMHDGRTDEQFVGRASELLTLLEDLELVLAQIVRLQDAHASRTELDLINRALQQRDVIPRLRNAAADISAN